MEGGHSSQQQFWAQLGSLSSEMHRPPLHPSHPLGGPCQCGLHSTPGKAFNRVHFRHCPQSKGIFFIMDNSIPCDGQAQQALPRGLCTSGLPFSVHCWGTGGLHFYLRKASSESLLREGLAGISRKL